jgi:hypothetical protein
VFGQLCYLLQEADIKTEVLFLNADAGFDSKSFRCLCQVMKLEAKIAFNPRNGNDQEYVYFDKEFFKSRMVIEHSNA